MSDGTKEMDEYLESIGIEETIKDGILEYRKQTGNMPCVIKVSRKNFDILKRANKITKADEITGLFDEVKIEVVD